jgi:hypothetical protein
MQDSALFRLAPVSTFGRLLTPAEAAIGQEQSTRKCREKVELITVNTRVMNSSLINTRFI